MVEACGLAIEVDVLDTIGATDCGIVASRLEYGIDKRVVLQIGTINNQGEVVDWHYESSIAWRAAQEQHVVDERPFPPLRG